jgi:hypothetical protein
MPTVTVLLPSLDPTAIFAETGTPRIAAFERASSRSGPHRKTWSVNPRVRFERTSLADAPGR